MARTVDATKHPALQAKQRQLLINGVEAHAEWALLSFTQQRWLSQYMVSGDAYAAAETTGQSMDWVADQLKNDDFMKITQTIRNMPSNYVKDLATQRLPAVLERLWDIIQSPNENTARAAIKDWMTVAGLVKSDLPPGATVNNTLNNIRMFGPQQPAMNKDELFSLPEVVDND